MTEREKMLAGELYAAWDEELTAMRRQARDLTYAYNNTTEADAEERVRLLKELLGGMGQSIDIQPPFRCDYGKFISVGERFYANFNLVILDCAQVTIGDDVLIGPNVQIYAAHHPLSPEERLTLKELASPIAIGNDVWVGGGAIILPGVTIGDGSVIGAGSVVTKDIPSRVVAVGNPCRVLKSLD